MSKEENHFLNLNVELAGSDLNQESIQNVYDNLPTGSVVEIPKNLSWDGSILKPNPSKHITWIFDNKISGLWPPPAGDGDVSMQYNNGIEISSRYLNNKIFYYPSNFFFWNDDPYFLGPWSHHWQQYSPANFKAISGPKSSGNTSAITAGLDSYGQNPSSSYDVGLSLNMSKYGQNSNWGLVIDQTDFSAKSPGAFAQWNEYDVWANGTDIQSWDPHYGSPQAGHRSVFFVNAHHLEWPSWQSLTSVIVQKPTQGSLPSPHVITVLAPDNQKYVWYAVASGKTGVTQPTFPAPTKVVGSVHNGILIVTKLVSGKILDGDYLTGSVPVIPIKIKKQLSGKIGEEGYYELDDISLEIKGDQPMYTAPRVYDNNVIWQFGEEYNMSVSSGIFFTGGDTYDTILSVDKNNTVSNAVLDSTLATFPSTSAAIRIGKGQVIDFSGDGQLNHRNKHTLSYEGNSFNYKVNGITVFSINDNGNIISSSPKYLPTFSRKDIFKISNPKYGMEVYDKNDDTIAIYTYKGWQLTALKPLPSE